jgi:Mg-chelatase subunit ChlD
MSDVLVAAELALSHRTREGGFLEPAAPQEIKDIFTKTVKKLFEFEKTGETTKKDMDKHTLMKGRAVFWVKDDATEGEVKRAEKNASNRFRKQMIRLQFFMSRFTGGTWGIGKRAKSNPPKDAPATDGIQVGGNKLQGQTYESDEKTKVQVKAIPTVSFAASSMPVNEGIPFIRSLQKKIRSPSSFVLKMGKIKTKRHGVYAGKRAQAVTALHRGKPYGWRFPHGKPTDIHIPATIREAARKQKSRPKPSETALRITLEDVREKLRSYKTPLTMVFVIDLSGSMLLHLENIKEALLKLHGDAYRFRDRVGIVALKGLGAVVVQHPITNLRVVANKLIGLRISGFTPLAAGMMKAREVLKEAQRRDPSTVPVMVMITDGSANVPLKRSLETGEERRIEEVNVIVREYEGLAVKDVQSVSKVIKRDGIHTIVINTNPHVLGRESYGLSVTEWIALITGGSHHAIGRMATKESMIENMIEDIREDQRNVIDEKQRPNQRASFELV